MYKDITVDRSLLYINQHHVDTFKKIANKMDEFSYIVKAGGINQKDAWIIAFNIWLLLFPDRSHIIQSVEKSLYYSSNFIILNAVIKDPNILILKQRNDATDELLYLTSLTIATGINSWTLYVMEKYNLKYMADKNKKRNYFDAYLGMEEEIKVIIEDEAKFVKALVKELNSTDSFNKMIKNCCENAYSLYLNKYAHSTY